MVVLVGTAVVGFDDARSGLAGSIQMGASGLLFAAGRQRDFSRLFSREPLGQSVAV